MNQEGNDHHFMWLGGSEPYKSLVHGEEAVRFSYQIWILKMAAFNEKQHSPTLMVRESSKLLPKMSCPGDPSQTYLP